MRLSDRLRNVTPSATIAITRAARMLRADGHDVIALSAGEPDFDTPKHICEAAVTAIASGQTRYTNSDGTPELKAAVQAKFARDNGLRFEPEQINVSPGGKAVIANAFAATLSDGDEVIVPVPYWVSYAEMPKLYGAVPVFAECRSFKLTPETLDAALSPRSRWLLLNSPGNPTGSVYSARELKALGDVLEAYPNVLVLSDDIYEHIRFDVAFTTFAAANPDLRHRTLTLNGLSKAYAMTGWRIGYAGGPKWLIDAMRVVMGQTTSCPCSISQAAGVAALEGPQDFLDDWLVIYRQRRDFVVQSLNALPGVDCTVPDGAFYVFPKLDTADDVAWCETILHETKVALVPGTAFGAPGHFRLSYATAMADLEEAMSRLRNVLT